MVLFSPREVGILHEDPPQSRPELAPFHVPQDGGVDQGQADGAQLRQSRRIPRCYGSVMEKSEVDDGNCVPGLLVS